MPLEILPQYNEQMDFLSDYYGKLKVQSHSNWKTSFVRIIIKHCRGAHVSRYCCKYNFFILGNYTYKLFHCIKLVGLDTRVM